MREYLITLLVAAAVTYFSTPIARRVAMVAGVMAPVRDRDVHTIPVPRFGGAAMYVGMSAALLVSSRLPTLESVSQRFSEPRALLLGGGVVFVIGALDDKFALDAVTKLAGQILAAAVIVLNGVQLLWLPIPHYGTVILGQEVSVVITVAFIVVVINAVNFVDGLDGLAAGIVGIVALAFFTLSYNLAVHKHLDYASPPILIAAVLAGMCIGFLPHNFNPARIFMGDSGSMLIGLLLAASTVSLTGQVNPGDAAQQYGSFLPLILPLPMLLIPFADLVLAILRRTRAGRAPWSPDKQHLHHRLLELGHSQRRAVLIMYFYTALVGAGAVALTVTQGPVLVVSIVLTLAVLAMLLVSLPRLLLLRRERRGTA